MGGWVRKSFGEVEGDTVERVLEMGWADEG